MSNAPLVAVIEDSGEIRQLLCGSLETAGFRTLGFGRAMDFERALPSLAPDVCIVDLGLPDKDGLGLVSRIAGSHQSAILVISGRASLQDKIVGLELGADDYLSKPFEIGEVVARVRALLRRRKPIETQDTQDRIHFSGWTVDLSQYTLTDRDGHTERLSAGEAGLLKLFLESPNRLVTRDNLRDALSDGDDEAFDRAIDVRVSRLRSKLKDPPKDPKIIKTIYGAGYIFIAEIGD